MPPDASATGRPQQWAAYAFGLVFATGVAYLVYDSGGRDQSDPSANATLQSYRALGDHEMEVTVDVERDPSRDTVCLLSAVDERGTDVGGGSVSVPAAAGGPGKVRVSSTISTRARGVTAEADGCVQGA